MTGKQGEQTMIVADVSCLQENIGHVDKTHIKNEKNEENSKNESDTRKQN